MNERADRLVAAGWEESEARAEAWRRMGNVARHRDEMMAQDAPVIWRRWMMGGLDGVRRDVLHAVRGMVRSPGFTAALVATLALGIGATGAIFSVVDAVLYRPLPFERPDRLIEVSLQVSEEFTIPELAADQVQPWIEGAEFLALAAAHGRRAMVRTDRGAPERLAVVAAGHTLDDVLGIRPAMGRMLSADDAQPGSRVVVLTDPYWRSLGAPGDVVGSTIELDGTAWDVVGVLPRGVKYPVAGTTELWIPLASDLTANGRPFTQLGVSGRLADGVSLEEATVRLNALNAGLAEALPHEYGWGVGIEPMGRWRANPEFRQGLWMVSGAVGLMFLIAGFNAINLLLARAQSRTPQVSIRKALGASRGLVARQMLTESLLLALMAGVVATGVAWLAVEGIAAIAPGELTFGMAHEFGLEARALVAVFIVATAAGVCVGLGPALRLANIPLRGVGQLSARTVGAAAERMRGVIVTVEVAAAVVLLTGAGLFIRSFMEMQTVDLGMDADRLAFASVQLPVARYPDGASRARFVDELLSEVRRIPGVETAVVAQGVPPEGGGLTFGSGFQGEGREPLQEQVLLPFGYAGPGYLDALGATLVSGRELGPSDRDTGGLVIDSDFARRLFGSDQVAGQRMRLGEESEWRPIVGVVSQLRFGGVDDSMGDGVVLYAFDSEAPPTYLDLVVRTADPEAALGPVREAFNAVDDRLPLQKLMTGTRAVSDATVRPRFLVLLMTILAGIAVVLAGLGIYGVLTYSVAQRRREIGIRLALGAASTRIQAGVIGWGARVAATGLVIGMAGAFLLDDLATSLLFGVRPGDLATRFLVAGGIAVATLLACWIPTRRATRVDPIEVLRSE